MTEYKQVEIEEALQAAEEYEDVHLSVNGIKLDLPNLQSQKLPIELISAVLLVKSETVLSEQDQYKVMATVLAYFQRMRPDFWLNLNKTGNPLGYVAATLKAWATESGIDPKALRSHTS
ncbi:hypothetical protein [Bifidobacterium sp.]|uniref:hypothetical protein n=1 Tax=Bifidobacterium sp. TaxID=41200 RepID=UPI0039EBEDEB